MFKNTFQSGFLSILYSIGSKPLQIWDKKVSIFISLINIWQFGFGRLDLIAFVANLDAQVRNGHIKRITDQDIQSFVLEIVGTNVSTTYITCPAGDVLVILTFLIFLTTKPTFPSPDPKKTLGIKLPYLVMIIKNMKKYFTFEVQVNWDPSEL